ncbi:hypothetical protein [Candidatus Mycoplasma haematominutum]|uniref:Uncharacterized protein n=1 Tax=Candidatus Mycoplasma haematominutum 'Birmingham 1' TaxID=1116213 RepID=G8C2K4_9MOLU|nr:hypothetical protein [Candidatus Mycoplasma haematominutum]CCE66552.1 hypothetical protein (homolog to MSU_0067) [Candidatus Mycoplasma haematominutum 'Birmingham 1']
MSKFSLKAAIIKSLDDLFGDSYRACKSYIDWFFGPIFAILRRVKSAISFFFWKIFPSRSSELERERYKKFIESLGGWKNVTAFTCRAKSWHLKITHEFLIDWDTLKTFNVKIIYWGWPYLDLSLGSYSRWMYKRLKRFSDKPIGRAIPKCSLKKN